MGDDEPAPVVGERDVQIVAPVPAEGADETARKGDVVLAGAGLHADNDGAPGIDRRSPGDGPPVYG